jgi:hypothetical protein
MVILLDPVFVIETLTAGLVVPIAWLAKLMEPGFTVTSARAGVLSAKEAITIRTALKNFPLPF